VMVGEIRDHETAEIAIQAALTGHLVLSTLHTNTAIGAITRLQDIGVEPYLLSSSITGLIAQRLVRVLCTECRAPGEATEGERQSLGAQPTQEERLAPHEPERLRHDELGVQAGEEQEALAFAAANGRHQQPRELAGRPHGTRSSSGRSPATAISSRPSPSTSSTAKWLPPGPTRRACQSRVSEFAGDPSLVRGVKA